MQGLVPPPPPLPPPPRNLSLCQFKHTRIRLLSLLYQIMFRGDIQCHAYKVAGYTTVTSTSYSYCAHLPISSTMRISNKTYYCNYC